MDKQLQAVADSQGNLSATANCSRARTSGCATRPSRYRYCKFRPGDQRGSTGTKLSALVESPVPLYFERTGYG